MSKPVYVLHVARLTEAWYQLSEQERESLLSNFPPIHEKFGVKTIIVCDARWSSGWRFAVEEYLDIEALQKKQEAENELDWPRYNEVRLRMLGTKVEWEPPS